MLKSKKLGLGWAGCATGREELRPGSEPGCGAGREHGGEGERGAPQALSAAQGAQALLGQAPYSANIAHGLLHPSRKKPSPAPAGAQARGEAGRRGRALQQPCATWKCWRPCWAVLGVSSKAGVGAGSVPWVAGSWPPRRPAFLRAGKPSHASCSMPGAPPPRAAPAALLDVTLEHSLCCFLGQEQSDARRIWSSARV